MANILQDERIKSALVELIVSILHGLKVFFVYILPATIVSVLVSPELQTMVSSNPSLVLYAPVINLAFSIIAGLIKLRLPEGSTLKKVL